MSTEIGTEERCTACGGEFSSKRQWWSPDCPFAIKQESEFTIGEQGKSEHKDSCGYRWFELRQCVACKEMTLLNGTRLVDGPSIPLSWRGR